jgi:hypothetical protein
MDARTHIELIKFFNIYRLVCPFFIFVAFISLLYAVPFIFIYFAALIPTMIIPAKCIKTECSGKMKLNTERLSFWDVTYCYQCEHCGAIYEEKIFDPDFQITSEFS